MARFTESDTALLGFDPETIESGEVLIESVVRHVAGGAIFGVEGGPAGAAELFDALAGYRGPAARRHFEESFRVIAAPGETAYEPIAPGDLILTRLLGEGGLARAAAIVRAGESDDVGSGAIEIVAAPLSRERARGRAREAGSRTIVLDLRQTPVDQLIVRARNGEGAAPEAIAIEEAPGESGGSCAPPGPVPAACQGLGPKEVLDCFRLGSARVEPRHQPQIVNIARCVLESQRTTTPITTLDVVGHTDPLGSDADNDRLGQRRADAVKAELLTTLNRMTGGGPPAVAITARTRGERDPLPGDAALSRRVEVIPPFVFTPGVPAPPVPRPRPLPRPRATALDPARWTRIMHSPQLRTGNFVDFLIDGPRAFRAMRDAILTATGEEHYIYLLGWWLTDDFPLVPATPPPVTIRELFADRSARGVQIRAMLWDQAFSTQNTAEVGRISALPNGAAILDGHTFSSHPTFNVGSHHQKVLVVKGEQGLITFCGGIDFNPDRIRAVSGGGSSSGGSSSGGSSGGSSRGDDGGAGAATASSSGSSGGAGSPMHDVHCRIVGPAAHDLLQTFIRRWDAHPDHVNIDATRGNLRGRTEPVPSPLAPRTIPAGSTGGNCAARITRTYNPVRPLAAGTSAVRERSIRETLILGIRNARRFIYMEDQYLVSLDAAAQLNAALSRIQHLTIVIPDSRISDMPRVWEARLSFVNRLTRGPHGHKVHVFFLATPPNTPGTAPVFGPHTYVHAKIWVFDDELAVIGSANCNNRGWTHDSEVNAVLFEDVNPTGQTFAQRFRMALWAEHLNVTPSRVADGVASRSLWTTPPPGARVRPYNPRAGTDPLTQRLIPMGMIDPDAGP
ncbi:MAG TPA: phospholipase D-like domain-containing protein [Candidatus Krumholzibacteria bacterium]|nr:phospholipase D-like domain-containing protein [Candidatus Krumholzibacteria bacterium]